MARVQSVGKGVMVGDKCGREVRIVERRFRREIRKLSLALSLNEADDNMGQTNSSDCSAVKILIMAILLRNMVQAVALLPL